MVATEWSHVSPPNQLFSERALNERGEFIIKSLGCVTAVTVTYFKLPQAVRTIWEQSDWSKGLTLTDPTRVPVPVQYSKTYCTCTRRQTMIIFAVACLGLPVWGSWRKYKSWHCIAYLYAYHKPCTLLLHALDHHHLLLEQCTVHAVLVIALIVDVLLPMFSLLFTGVVRPAMQPTTGTTTAGGLAAWTTVGSEEHTCTCTL